MFQAAYAMALLLAPGSQENPIDVETKPLARPRIVIDLSHDEPEPKRTRKEPRNGKRVVIDLTKSDTDSSDIYSSEYSNELSDESTEESTEYSDDGAPLPKKSVIGEDAYYEFSNDRRERKLSFLNFQ